MPLDFPDVPPSREDWQILTSSKSFTSDLNGIEQSSELPGSKFAAVLSFTNLLREEVFALRGFLAGLRGRTGNFYLQPVDSKFPLSSPTGSPTVDGSGQIGGTLATQGWGANELVRRAGEYFEVNGELKMITEDITSDASGNATLVFQPNLHNSPGNLTSIEYAAPRAKMRLINDNQARWQLAQSESFFVSFNCIEDLR